jgi:uncharacterized protein (TIGR02001 family)
MFRFAFPAELHTKAHTGVLPATDPNLNMNKKLTALLLASGLAGATVARAAADYSVTLDTTFVSQYMFRGIKLSGPSIQPSVELTSGDVAVGIWASDALSNWNPSYSEVDFYGSYTFKIDDSLSIPVGGTVYWYPESNSPLHEVTYEVYVGVDYTIEGISLGARAYYDIEMEGFTFEASAGYSLPLAAIGSSLDFSAFIGTWALDEGDELNTEIETSYWGVGVEVPYQLAENASFTVGVGYHDGFGGKVNGVDADLDTGGKVVFSTGISVGF